MADTADIIDYESGALSEAETVRLFADLVKTGLAWSLQGSYGRTAAALIEAEVISPEGEVLTDLDDFDPRDHVVVDQEDPGTKWFLNEEGTPYPYPQHLQEEHYPNDFHTAYDTEAEAEAASEEIFEEDEEVWDEDDSLLDSEMKALGWPPYDLPDTNVDCGHCITPEDRCSDISDRNCMGRH